MQIPLRATTILALLLAWNAVLGAEEAGERANILISPARELIVGLKTTQDSADKEKFADAVVELRKILAPAVEDGFLPPEDQYGTQHTLKSEAIRLFDALPEDARQLYELQTGAELERSLGDSLRHGDKSALAEVAKNYFPCRLAADAAMLLAHDALEHGRSDECLAWIRRVEAADCTAKPRQIEIALLKAACYLSSDDAVQTRRALDGLKEIHPPIKFRLGAKEHSTDEPIARLAPSLVAWRRPPAELVSPTKGDWPMYRGDASRNATAEWSGGVGEKRWKVGTLDAVMAKQFSTWRRSNADNVLFSCLHPLVVGDVLLARTPRRLVAYELRSGKLLWQNPPDERSLAYVPNSPNGKPDDPNAELWQRFWDDAPFGQMSSNGSEVFLLEGLDLAQPGDGGGARLVAIGGQLQIIGQKGARPFNRLMAVSLRKQGQTLWSVGGEKGDSEPQLAGYFFLGPPLPHEQKLFVLAEKDGTIRLCALDAASGRLEWTLAIAQLEAGILTDPVRRLAGACPSMSEGILVCPTSAGAVAAVDPVTRSLVWGYQYPLSQTLADRNPVGLVLPNGRMQPLHRTGANRTVRDAAAVQAAGKTLLLPVEADHLLCLDTATGRLIWSCARGEMQAILGITADKVILSGGQKLYAQNLQTGRPAWREAAIDLPGKAQCGGRGFLAGKYFYLPTTWNEIIQFDVDAGRIAERFSMKTNLGNLTAVENLLISQTGESVQVFNAKQ
jgi:hypothetical protein